MLTSASVFTLVTLSLTTIHAHAHAIERRLPGQWYHEEDHPVYELFKRDTPTTDGQTYPQVGGPGWGGPLAAFSQPGQRPTKDKMPAAWFTALDAAVQAGKIPNIPVSTLDADGNPVYPAGTDGNGPQVCSLYNGCKQPGVHFDAPDGVFGTSFDDGPLPPTDTLVDFLTSQGVTTTHFMIGVNIMGNPQQFLKAFNAGHDIAVHTWTHPKMTSLSNEDVVIELAATMDIIQQPTGGRIPKYWRPPTGDADTRVVAIAKEVLGLETIKWNQDTEDWNITTNGLITSTTITTDITGWLKGPKSPGLIILEHELYNGTVQAFMDIFPQIKQNGWTITPVTQLYNDNTPYRNAGAKLSAPVTQEDILATASSSPSNSSTGSTGSTGSSGTPSNGTSGSNSSSGSGGNSTGATSNGTNHTSAALSALDSSFISRISISILAVFAASILC